MKCKDCEHFEIGYPPMMPYDSGLAVCKKHNLVCDYTSNRKLNRLTCVEEAENAPQNSENCREQYDYNYCPCRAKGGVTE